MNGIQKNRKQRAVVFALLAAALAAQPVMGLLNPAAAYCDALGYGYQVVKTASGESGACRFPDGSSCDGWDFAEGKCGQKYSFCSVHGYGIKTVSTEWRNYSACVLANGTEVEAMQLMGLDLKTERCGDGRCGLGENNGNCPRDCPSGARDGYCDRASDGKCDPDCKAGGDPDCAEPAKPGTDGILPYLLAALFVVAVIYLCLRKRKK